MHGTTHFSARRRLNAALSTALFLLSGCSQQQPMVGKSAETVEAFDLAGSPAAPAAGTGAAPAVAIAAPRIAYVYRRSYRLAPARIGAVQDAHVALCDRLGPSRCQLIALERAAGDEDAAGSLKLQVAAPLARRFAVALDQAVGDAGGRTVQSAIAAEDVSKQIIDVAARIRARETLVARLTEILKTRTGTIEQLTAAEKAIASAQEELDAARSWAAELSLRVSTSSFEIGYASAGGSALFQPLHEVARDLGGYVGSSLAALLLILALAMPWALLGLLVLALRRWWRRRAERLSPGDSAP